MKKWPKTVEIGGQVFKIVVYKTAPRKIKKELGEICGWCDFDNKLIGLIKKYVEKDNLTLFHEIGHASADATRAKNPLTNENFARPFLAIFYSALKAAKLIK